MGLLCVTLYNRLVKDRNQVENAWSDVDVQLKRRHDLVLQLVEAVKGYARFEQATLTGVTELRRQSDASTAPSEKAALENKFEKALHRLVVVVEDYPDLKADRSFIELQNSLVETEDVLQKARRFYNGSVRIYNTRIFQFPHLIVAKTLSFERREYFEADAASRVAPRLELN